MDTTTIESQILATIEAEVQQRFAAVADPAHGWEHVQRVYQLALYIAEREGANRFIVGLAALMHDLGRIPPPHAVLSQSISAQQTQEATHSTHHADLSVALARELLQAQEISLDRQQAVCHAILAHSFSRKIEPQTLEAGVVRDADRLDGLGAIGILRWAITGTMRRTLATRSYHPDDPFAEWHTLDDGSYMLDHFFSKLLKLRETMTTQTGRILAERRTEFMYAYLEEFRQELAITDR